MVEQAPASPSPPPYPAQLAVDYPDRPLNKLTTFFRLITIIPIFIVLALVAGGFGDLDLPGDDRVSTAGAGGGVLFFATVAMIVFRQKYPRWWFDWNLQLLRFENRVAAYLLLLRDEYPSTDEEQAVRLDLRYPDAKTELNRWLPLVKWLLAVPHYIVLLFLAIGVLVAVIIAWFAILFTGRYPRDLFNFVVGVMRWALRVVAYGFVLTTDRYPPFNTQE